MPSDRHTLEALEVRRMVHVMRELGGPSGQPLGAGWLVADSLGSWADYAVGLGMDGPEPPGRAQAVIDYYVSRGRVPRIQVSESADPGWVESLISQGFGFYNSDIVLIHTLAERATRAREPITFTRVDPHDPAQLELWVQAQCQAFNPYPSMPEGAQQIARRVAFSPRTICLLGFWDGALAASGGLEFYAQSSVLFGGATLPAFRKRGLQSALIQRRLDLARERGAAYALIGSEPGGPTQRNAERAGFTAHHQVRAYKR